jgi:hypothetical protein
LRKLNDYNNFIKNRPTSRKANIVIQEFESELLIYDLNINRAYCLNQTSAMVYQLSDGTRTITEIADEMSVKLRAKVTEDLVWFALAHLKKDNLLENTEQLSIPFDGLSRREVVKRVGLASVVMLPVISSIVAPRAANAASSACGGSCKTLGQNPCGELAECTCLPTGGNLDNLTCQGIPEISVCGGSCTTLGQNPCNGNAACTCLGVPGNLTCQ